MIRPEICVLKTDGTNCDMELAHAFEVSGASASIVHVNQLRAGDVSLDNFQGLGLPGGFSYGDDVAAGKILANELTTRLSDDLQRFIDAAKPIIGICNGFQVQVRSGLIPGGELGRQTAALADNQIGHFVCRWVELEPQPSVSPFFQPEDFGEASFPIQTAHGEGQFVAEPAVMQDMEQNGQLLFRYIDPKNPGGLAVYPYNPSGSAGNIAGVCDPSGLIVGMMPHPERSVSAFHPNRTRTVAARSAAAVIFNGIVNYTKEV